MYKPPENSNRVKAIKEKFEDNCRLQKSEISIGANRHLSNNKDRTVCGSSVKEKSTAASLVVESNKTLTLSRQLSDPIKRNVKRTPAFRLDRCPLDEKDAKLIQNRTKCIESRLSKNCDNYLQSNPTKDEDSTFLTSLYTAPIPKHLRSFRCEAALKKDTKDGNTPKIDDLEKIPAAQNDCLTETLKLALKKPLPPGPAPQKPPRTFIHSTDKDSAINDNLEANDSFNLNKQVLKTLEFNIQQSNSDTDCLSVKNHQNHGNALYMLAKLENALKNSNNACLKRKVKETSVQCYNNNNNNNNNNNLHNRINKLAPSNEQFNRVPSPTTPKQKFNLNCLSSSLSCTSSAYKKVKENFFGNCDNDAEEPLYAEPFQFVMDKFECSEKMERARAQEVDDNGFEISHNASDESRSFDNASISSNGPSDLEESTASTHSEETSGLLEGKKVKDIIGAFEKLPTSSKLTKKMQKSVQNNPKTEDYIKKFEQLGNKLSSHSIRGKRNGSIETTKKFEIYVKRVRSKIYAEPFFKKDAYKHLFDCCLLVGLNRNIPYIKQKFPEHVKLPQRIEDLCFPDAQSDNMDLSESAQCYSLVITNSNGERTYGYCRRVLPEGSSCCLPLAYCILSQHSAPGFYKKILQELESRHGFSEKFKNNFLSELFNSRFPKPGEAVKINLSNSFKCIDHSESIRSSRLLGRNDQMQTNNSEVDLTYCTAIDRLGEYAVINFENKRDSREISQEHVKEFRKSCSSPTLLFEDSSDCFPFELIFIRPSDSRHEENNLQMLCHSLPINILQQVFSSLLLERKVILVSSELSKISSCVEALQVTLYPFLWPHTLIPVLPRCLWEILEAPTPLLCGVLSKEVVNLYKIENGIVVDLDEGNILLKEGDEEKILRWTLLDVWKDGISLANSIPNHESAQNVLLSDAFLRVFIRSCGHYKQYIDNGQFQKKSFIESGKLKGRGVRSFLTWFTETTMFYAFIEAIIKEPKVFRIFDQRIEIYSSESTGNILKKMKERPKEKNSFFKFN